MSLITLTVEGYTNVWPQDLNPNLKPIYYIETGYDYLNNKTFQYPGKNINNTYDRAVLDIYKTNSRFRYRSYEQPQYCTLRTEIGPEILPNVLQVFGQEQAILTLGECAPGKVYHITDFNPDKNGPQAIIVPELDTNLDITPVKLLATDFLAGNVSGQYLGFSGGVPENIYENNGQLYEKYSIGLARTFNTQNILNPRFENQLVEYDYEGLYKGSFRNTLLQEFQERTLGDTYLDTFQYKDVGTILVTKVKTINENDNLRFINPTKPFATGLIDVVLKDFYPHNKEITLELSPGIYDITRIPLPYSDHDQVSVDQIRVNPTDGYITITIDSNRVFSLEPDLDAVWGGWVKVADNFGVVNETYYLPKSNFSNLTVAEVNAASFENFGVVTTVYNQFSNDFNIASPDKIDTFGNPEDIKNLEYINLSRVNQYPYLNGIWDCYTQFPYSSLYNDSF